MNVETILTISYVIKSEGNYANDLAGNTPQFIPASEPARPILERGVRRYKKTLTGLPDNSVLWTKLKLELPGDTRGKTGSTIYDYTGVGDTKDDFGHYPRKMIGLINRENGVYDNTTDSIKWTASVDISDYELIITKAEMKYLAEHPAQSTTTPTPSTGDDHSWGTNNDAGVPGPAQQVLDKFLEDNFGTGSGWTEIPYVTPPKRSNQFANNPVLIA